jgi:MFS family permease
VKNESPAGVEAAGLEQDTVGPTVVGRGTDSMTAAEVDEAIETIPARNPLSPFYAFTFRNFRLYFYGQSISVAGTWMQSVAQQWLIWQLTRSAAWLGIVSGASAIPYVLFAVWGGQMADRYSRRNILICTQAGAMILAVLLALLATNRWVPIQAWHVAALSGVSSIINAFNMPAQQAFVTDMVDDRKALGNAIALNSLRFNLSRFIGPILAGMVLVKSSVAVCFFLNAVSYIAVILSLYMMRLPHVKASKQATSVWEGFGYIWFNRNVLRIVMLVGLSALTVWPLSTLFPVFATKFHVGAKGYSWMMSINGIGAALGGLLLAALTSRLSRRLTVYGGALSFCLAALFLSCAPTYHLALLSLFLSGFSMIIFGISCNTKVQEEVPDTLRGRVMAVYSLVFNGLFPIGGLTIGFLAQHLSASIAIRINATICLLICLTLLAWSLAERRALERALANAS